MLSRHHGPNDMCWADYGWHPSNRRWRQSDGPRLPPSLPVGPSSLQEGKKGINTPNVMSSFTVNWRLPPVARRRWCFWISPPCNILYYKNLSVLWSEVLQPSQVIFFRAQTTDNISSGSPSMKFQRKGIEKLLNLGSETEFQDQREQEKTATHLKYDHPCNSHSLRWGKK